MNRFRNFDVGVAVRSKGASKDDCQVRALTVATGMRYADAWALLYTIQKERHGCAFELVAALRARDSRFPIVREVSFPAERGKRRVDGHAFLERYPRGSWIVSVAHHVAAVEDGVLIDTWDCRAKCVYVAWEVRAVKGQTS